ncbi:GTPase activating protein (SH3 domain) binding protein [Datura stramonium]|uniref:GTPase activating protein (SH3 domain) binding protein n=1 Tax=Datura stramonium TaxID=4076 RepID=A0ABS8RVH7_DATST|nr:GTPase activating protein (SH3 domain) binding protein [Datura stramonium]
MVTACLIGQDDSRKSFSQSFFLAPQDTGYYILNDIFRFISVEESSAVVDEKMKQGRPSPAAQDNFYNDSQYNSIYIEGLSIDTTISDLYDVVKVFGPIHIGSTELIKTHDDGYYRGFVCFQDSKSAQNVVQVATRGHTLHRIEVNFAEVVLNCKAKLEILMGIWEKLTISRSMGCQKYWRKL